MRPFLRFILLPPGLISLVLFLSVHWEHDDDWFELTLGLPPSPWLVYTTYSSGDLMSGLASLADQMRKGSEPTQVAIAGLDVQEATGCKFDYRSKSLMAGGIGVLLLLLRRRLAR